jgi:hypothetical protein
MVDDAEAGAIELSAEQPLGERHAHRVSQALPERAGGGLDPERRVVLRVSRGLAAQLAEALQVLDRDWIAGQI